VLPKRPDWIFASEAYGARLAEELGATFVPVDPARSVVPVSGTAIRRDPLANWRFLPPCVRPYFAKRVVVFGPESCGKSTLAARLAAHYQTAVVPEYARTLLEAQGGRVERRDLERIARGQIASEEVLAEECQRLLICDTDPLTTHIWSEALYGGCEPWLAEEAARRRYDLHLLLDVDVPFVPDPVRYLPGQREAFFERCRAALESSGRPFVRVRGGWEQRFATAVDAIDRLLQPL
jgi:NadR type nicotinamide-nucleotide adenylyltransferase